MGSSGFIKKLAYGPKPKFRHSDFGKVDWDAARKHVAQFEKPVKVAVKRMRVLLWVTHVAPTEHFPGIEISLWRKYGIAHADRKSFTHPQGIVCCATILKDELKEAQTALRKIVAEVARDNMHLVLLLPAPIDGLHSESCTSKLLFRISINDFNEFLPKGVGAATARDT